jgi:hypothetical protein
MSPPNNSDECGPDPWEIDDCGPDPWEIDDCGPDPWEPDEVVESRELAISEEDSDEMWSVKYAPGAKEPTKRDLEAREKRNRFLDVLMRTGNAVLAAARVGVGWRALYLARSRHPDFDSNWNMATKIYNTFVAQEKMRKRALDGIRKPIYYQGNIVGYEVYYDSGLTQFYMRGAMPDVYGDKRELKIEGGLTFGVALLPSTMKSLGEWEDKAKRLYDNGEIIDITPTSTESPAPKEGLGRG